MVIGHADKIRMQVRSIDSKGKIYIDCDSFIPQTLIGHEVIIFSENNSEMIKYNGVIQAIVPIHYVEEDYIKGNKGIKKEDLYVDLGLYSKKLVKELGIKTGDPILLNREIKRTLGPDTFSGAYLDNGVGCYTVCELARRVSESDPNPDLTIYFAISTYEEINRLGSRVMVSQIKPDIIIAVDACHDYYRAPNVDDKHYPKIKICKGPVISYGSTISKKLNDLIIKACKHNNIPYQYEVVGDDTGTDSMSGVLGNIDSATASIGIPVLNMHTIAESGCISDINNCIECIYNTFKLLNSSIDLKNHINLSDARNGNFKMDSDSDESSESESDISTESSESESENESESSDESEEGLEEGLEEGFPIINELPKDSIDKVTIPIFPTIKIPEVEISSVNQVNQGVEAELSKNDSTDDFKLEFKDGTNDGWDNSNDLKDSLYEDYGMGNDEEEEDSTDEEDTSSKRFRVLKPPTNQSTNQLTKMDF